MSQKVEYLTPWQIAAIHAQARHVLEQENYWMLAGEEYAREVETANGVFRRIGGQESPEPEPNGTPPFEPDAPTLGDAGTALPTPPSDDDEPSDETGDTAARLEEGARLAKMQAAARAKAQEKSRTPKASEKTPAPPEATTLIGDVLDGPVRRGRGRPPGARNRPKPGNDDAIAANGVDAA